MFNSAFDGITGNTDDYWPDELRGAIEPVNARIYDTVNNGVYKAGFATSQDAYDEAVRPLFDTLDWLEDVLSRQRYLMGERVTEAVATQVEATCMTIRSEGERVGSRLRSPEAMVAFQAFFQKRKPDFSKF